MSPAALIRRTNAWTPARWRGSVVRMKSSNEMSRCFQTSRNSCSIRSQYASGSSPSSRAFRNTFWECSSFPMTKWVSTPHSRLYRAITSAAIFSYAVPRWGRLFDVVDGCRKVEAGHSSGSWFVGSVRRSIRSSFCSPFARIEPGAGGDRLHILDRHAAFGRDARAVVELRRGIQHAPVARRHFEADRADRRLDRSRSRDRDGRAASPDSAPRWWSCREQHVGDALRASRDAR